MTTIRLASASSLVMATALATAPAIAQEAPRPQAAQDTSASEIIVTARKRAESAQDVPLSIAVISGTKLQEQNLNSIESLQSVTAGLVIRKTPNNIVNLTLRGLGTGSAVDSFEQSVATFIDGTYAGRGAEFNAALFDFDRIEVIRGAQASLLSKNTSLGAISLTTRKPGDVLAANITASHDFSLGSNTIDAGIDIPLSDTLKVRLAGKFEDQHGYIDNTYYDDKVPRSKNMAGRIIVKYTPTDSLDVTVMYQHYRNRGKGIGVEYYLDPFGQVASLAALAGDTTFETKQDRSKAESSDLFGESYEHTSGNRAVATINYELPSGHTLTSVTSYSDFDSRRQRDTDFIVGDYVNAFYYTANRQFQQELRITSPAEGQFLDYVVGGSYFHEKWLYDDDTFAQCIGCSPAQLAAFPLRGRTQSHDDQRTRDWAAFGQVNLHFTDTLTLSGGVRYTNERRSALLSRTATVPGLLAVILYPPFSPVTLRRKESNVDGSLGVNWKPTNNLLVYVSASKGTKSGGFINFATNPTTPAGALAAEYGNETAHTYEVGGKLTLPAGGFFNVTVFRTDISNFQQAIFINPTYLTTQRDLRSQGVEVETGVQVIPGIRLSGQVTYADTARRDAGHLRPPGAPKWSGNANVSVRQPLTDTLSFTGDFGLEFRSDLFLTDEDRTIGYPGAPNNVIPRSDAYGIINARAGIKSQDGWELALVGKNLNNRHVLQYGTPASLIGTASYVAPNAPRTVAIQVSYKY